MPEMYILYIDVYCKHCKLVAYGRPLEWKAMDCHGPMILPRPRLRFLLTSLLLPRLEQSSEARIVHVSAKAHESFTQRTRQVASHSESDKQVSSFEASVLTFSLLLIPVFEESCFLSFATSATEVWKHQYRGADFQVKASTTLNVSHARIWGPGKCWIWIFQKGLVRFLSESSVVAFQAPRTRGKCECWGTLVAPTPILS